MEHNEQQFIKGFNNGYVLAKHEPDLLSKIVQNISSTNDYLTGFFSGKEEYEIEYSHTQLQDLKRIRSQSRDRGYDLERE